MKKPILLELFAGTRSIGKVAEKFGYEVYSVEIDPSFGCNITMDILLFYVKEFIKKYGVIPDAVWASPDCTSYSIAACGHHRNKDYTPKTEKAILGDKLLSKTIEIITELLEINLDLKFAIENPVGIMRKTKIMKDFLLKVGGKIDTVTYCQYGDTRMKPTDIFNNLDKFFPKRCKNGASCHESAPRGSRTGTQGIKGSKLRSVIPEKLCEDIILSLTK